MKIAFRLGDAKLDAAEAKALMSTAVVEPIIEIDIAKHVDPSMIDARKLFNLSVEKQLPTLATLAARFAIEGVKVKKERRPITNRIVDIVPTTTVKKPDEAIGELNEGNSLKSLGAAMILHSLSAGQKRTLRQIAVSLVNELAFKGNVSADSACFRGFVRDSEGNFKPLLQEGAIGRSECYHASPVYGALRDGLALLAEMGLVKTSKTTEFGSKDKEVGENAALLRRTVYTAELTESGMEVVDQWADISDFISRRWSQRVRNRKTYAAA